MKKIRDIIFFISNGMSVFAEAARGEYYRESPEMKALREEIMSDNKSDAENLRQDWRNVKRDIRVSFDKLVLDNG